MSHDSMRILVPVDGSENSLNALRFIAQRQTLLASRPEIVVMTVQEPLPARACRLVGTDALERYYKDEADKIFEAVDKVRGDLPIVTKYAVGEPVASLAEEVNNGQYDLIVLNSRGQGAIRGLFFGSVSTGLLAATACPVLMLRGNLPEGNPTKRLPGDGLRVALAVDGSVYSRAAVRYIARHRSIFGAHSEYLLTTVVSDYAGAVMPDMAGMALPTLSEADIADLQKEEFDEVVRELRPILAHNALTTTDYCLVGNPGDEIARFSQNMGVDLIVMGSHGYGRFKAAVLGSVATRVAASCDTPLLLIRSSRHR